MTDKDTNQEKLASDSPRVPRKPYVKPEFRYERAFETMALACGKMTRHPGALPFQPQELRRTNAWLQAAGPFRRLAS